SRDPDARGERSFARSRHGRAHDGHLRPAARIAGRRQPDRCHRVYRDRYALCRDRAGVDGRDRAALARRSLAGPRAGKPALNRIMFRPTIPGPDPDTRIPKFRLPPLSCDAHCHVFGPGSKYPYAPDRPYTPPDAPLADFRALHRKIGVGRAVIVNASVHGTDNRVALDAIAESGGAYRAVANIDDTITEGALRELHDGGFRGCRFNFVRHLGGVPD